MFEGRTQCIDLGMELSASIRDLALPLDGGLGREPVVDLLMEPTPMCRESLLFSFKPHEFTCDLVGLEFAHRRLLFNSRSALDC